MQAHPCFPEQTLEFSFCMVSKSFFQTINFTLQVYPSGSSGQVSYVITLSADNPLCKADPVFPVSALVMWKSLRVYGLIPAQLCSKLPWAVASVVSLKTLNYSFYVARNFR